MGAGPISRRQVISMGVGLVAGAEIVPNLTVRAERKKATFVLVHGAWHGG